MLFKSGKPGSFNIASVAEGDTVLALSGKEAAELVEKLNGVGVTVEGAKAKRIRVEAIQSSTPKKKPAVVTIGESSPSGPSAPDSSVEEILLDPTAPLAAVGGRRRGRGGASTRGRGRGGRGGAGPETRSAATKESSEGGEKEKKKVTKKKEKQKELPALPEENEEEGDVDMKSSDGSEEDTRESLKLIINKLGSKKYNTREVGEKSARLDTS